MLGGIVVTVRLALCRVFRQGLTKQTLEHTGVKGPWESHRVVDTLRFCSFLPAGGSARNKIHA